MAPLRLGWFFNAHGSGHRNRLRTIAPFLSAEAQLTTLSYGESDLALDGQSVPHIALPAFNQPVSPQQPNQRYLRQQVWRSFHGLQLNGGGNAEFFAQFTGWLAQARPDLLVVDVALEAALGARLCGVPVVYMRQHGQRWDLGHRIAYEASLGLIAPFAQAMEEPDCPRWIKEKTFYSGGFCRFGTMPLAQGSSEPAEIPPPPAFAQAQSDKRNVVVLVGAGGTNFEAAAIAQAAQATPHWRWFILGRLDQPIAGPSNIVFQGFTNQVLAHLRHADLVIANGGHNTVMEIGAASAPFVCFPAARPFHEQRRKAAVLEQLDLATVISHWPDPAHWKALMQQAQVQRDRNCSTWQSMLQQDAPRRIAQWIEAQARRCQCHRIETVEAEDAIAALPTIAASGSRLA